MTFARIDFPESLSNKELDQYLELGWFRMGQAIFTTNFLNFRDQHYNAVWLRVSLENFSVDRTFLRLSKLNAGFKKEIKEAELTAGKERLFKKYKGQTNFQAATSLKQLMYGKSDRQIFTTYEINIYDKDELIATGFFDLGGSSVAGITCFYDPAYRKYSLGKYLIYLKMEYCREKGFRFFYPGYFVPGYNFFDYKLSIGKPALQFLELGTSQWKRMEEFSFDNSPLKFMEQRLQKLKDLLIPLDIKSWILTYEFFDANLIPELQGAELFDYPLFMVFSENQDESTNHLIVYDIRESAYCLVLCRGVWKVGTSKSHEKLFSAQILKEIHSHRIAFDAADVAQWILERKSSFVRAREKS
jgi:arginine-tRNA-protein transferase